MTVFVVVVGGFLGVLVVSAIAACLLAGRGELRAAAFPPREDDDAVPGGRR